MKIGITGGIGSGKTKVCNYFETLGIPVFYADSEAKLLYNIPEIINWLKVEFSSEIFDHNNILNKKKLAEIIFNDPSALRKLENKIHPLVKNRFEDWYEAKKQYPYVLYEAAILFETGHFRQLDKNILVKAPVDLRMERIIKRDRLSQEEISRRMAHQWSDEKKILLADFVIENINWDETIKQIEYIHQQILQNRT